MGQSRPFLVYAVDSHLFLRGSEASKNPKENACKIKLDLFYRNYLNTFLLNSGRTFS